jgi:hypothetical protein
VFATGRDTDRKNADFIVLDASPVDDNTNARNISWVILCGAAVDRSKLPNLSREASPAAPLFALTRL